MLKEAVLNLINELDEMGHGEKLAQLKVYAKDININVEQPKDEEKEDKSEADAKDKAIRDLFVHLRQLYVYFVNHAKDFEYLNNSAGGNVTDNIAVMKHAFKLLIDVITLVQKQKKESNLKVAVDNNKVIEDRFGIFSKIENAYKKFLRLTEGNTKYDGIAKAFNNLINVIQNIIVVANKTTGIDLSLKI